MKTAPSLSIDASLLPLNPLVTTAWATPSSLQRRSGCHPKRQRPHDAVHRQNPPERCGAKEGVESGYRIKPRKAPKGKNLLIPVELTSPTLEHRSRSSVYPSTSRETPPWLTPSVLANC